MKILPTPNYFEDSKSIKGVIASIKKGTENVIRNIELILIMASEGGVGFLNAVSKKILALVGK